MGISYLWLKSLHIIFMTAWFAGLFYIFRIFVYHVKHRHEEPMTRTLKIMEKKLLYIIMLPAMLLTLVTGFGLAGLNQEVFREGWFYVKLAGVFGLLCYHHLAMKVHRWMSRGEYRFSENACRLINEIPTVLLILIVILVVLKPWL
ncbi:MAG: protoporphyrinogen oxidase HemJ [Deltaproteobacteria bacterium]|nr:protoporphyrinogen oxidase HemJ [Deltaproteobacteria bacterium]MBI2501426.1 protoporphyrinogen oxidase HemJ [Deltaproteobacteria bacterium]